MGDSITTKFPYVKGMGPTTKCNFNAYINQTWKAELAITGADGLPPTAIAGNVLRPETTLKLSMRLPPTKNSQEAVESLKKILTKDPPYGATVEVSGALGLPGWNAPVNEKYLDDSM